ncbi:MAG: DEAD/DEAH box helicase family protein [Parabacteroides sp.]
MIKEVRYQTEAVAELVAKTRRLLESTGERKRLVFKAPTGSGKTVMASKLLDELVCQLAEEGQAVAMIWIAPNKLHQQSYFRMKSYFTESRHLHPVMYDELDHAQGGFIKPGEIFFVNWESINKDSNLMVRETEQSASLYDLVRRTKEEQGMQLLVVIDEEHLFGGRSAKQSEKVLKQLAAKVEIRISATPITALPDALVTVPREEVIRAEMIKEGITINPGLREEETGLSENDYLLDLALQRRNEIKAAYEALGVRINPLLLIQLPNDNSEKLDDQERSIIEQIRMRLEMEYDITTDNERLAIWLSGEKRNVEGLERSTNLTEVLLFKQAIAMGWDCPRAAVLLIFREISSTQFGIQTVGRIMRMPEQRHYPNQLLNHGWVYTNLSRDRIEIVAEDMGYLSKSLMAYRREALQNVRLQSVYSERLSADRMRLGPDFWPLLVETFSRNWFNVPLQLNLFAASPFEEVSPAEGMMDVARNRQKAQLAGIDLGNHAVRVSLVRNVEMTGEAQSVRVEETSRVAYRRTQAELQTELNLFLERLLTKFERISVTSLRGYLNQFMEAYLQIFESDVPRVVLYNQNKGKFADLLSKAIARYEKQITDRREAARQRAFKVYTWEVPEAREYNENSCHEEADRQAHALQPFVQQNSASTPERRFEAFLEKNRKAIDWWYKNGDEGKQHYAIPYEPTGGGKRLFYVDFVLRMRNGQLFLFDTKSAESDAEAPQKHNALLRYMQEVHPKQHLKGGVLIEDVRTGNWLYSPLPITDTTDTLHWDAFFPDQYM